LVGDLVNRGPRSVDVLRFVKGLGERAIAVLGNHDLHLLAVAAGVGARSEDESLEGTLTAPDREEILEWLRHRPLMHRDQHLGYSLLHAGLPPQWDLPAALAHAAEVERMLRGPHYGAFLGAMYGNSPMRWSDDLRGMERLRFITNCFTRLRYCDAEGNLGLAEKGAPGSQSPDYLPWFEVPGRASAGERIIFGHWSTLGYLHTGNVWALDSGCLWGGALTALPLRRKGPARAIQLPCSGALEP
jgi:bis(5'-nucleosyl)-tetraphosphatase (symmetrical)